VLNSLLLRFAASFPLLLQAARTELNRQAAAAVLNSLLLHFAASFPLLLHAAVLELHSLLLPLADAALLLQATLAVLHSLLAKLISPSKHYFLLQMYSGGCKVIL
jgi:hypothetical protein